MGHCANCGTEVTLGARYCTSCGTPVGGVVEREGGATRVRPSAETIAAQEQGLLVALRKATLGEYEILGEIGRGGMAVVYLGHDLALDRKVAIKVMSPALKLMDPGVQERFHREARTAAALSHPHIIPVFAVKQTDGLVYFVMKFIVGRSLESVLKELGPMPIPLVQAVLGQVGNALGHAHKRGVVHRDMKPGNVMLDEDGWVVVTDFGIAKVADAEALTQTGGMVGTPAYMSPEQCAGGNVTGASDQYSLGIMAYEMIAGRQPFTSGGLVGLIYDHCHTPPPPLLEARPDCPPETAAAVMRMLEKDPAKRWPTIEQAVAGIGAGTETQSGEIKTHMMSLVQAGGTRVLLDKFKTPGSPVPRTATGKPTPPGATAGSVADATARIAETPAAPRRRSPLVWGVPLAVLGAAGGLWLALGLGPGRHAQGAAAGADSAAQPTAPPVAAQTLTQPVAPPPAATRTAATRSSGGPGPSADSAAPVVTAAAPATRMRSPAPPVTPSRPSSPAPATTNVSIEPAAGSAVVGDTARPAASASHVTADAESTAAAPAAATTQPAPQVTPPAPAPAPSDPRPAIQQALESYRRAIESRDLARLKNAYPGLTADQADAWRSFFANVTDLTATLQLEDLQVAGDRAEARVAATYEFRSGAKQTQHVQQAAVFERGAAGWRLIRIK